MKETKVSIMCCGEKIPEILPNSTEAAMEKPVPVYTLEGNTVKVSVGSIAHPMTDKHHIEWVP